MCFTEESLVMRTTRNPGWRHGGLALAAFHSPHFQGSWVFSTCVTERGKALVCAWCGLDSAGDCKLGITRTVERRAEILSAELAAFGTSAESFRVLGKRARGRKNIRREVRVK